MHKKILWACLALALAGCNLTLAQAIAAAQTAALGICAVAPTASTITALIIASNGGDAAASLDQQTATAVAQAFCGAVAGKPATPQTAALMRKFGAHVRAAAPRAIGNGVVNYGTVTVNGNTIQIEGTPAR